MKKTLVFGVSALALLAVPALARHHEGPGKDMTRAEVEAKVAEKFAAGDANKDGKITTAEFEARLEAHKAEMRAKMAKHHDEMFTKLDTDKNGQLSKAEWNAMHEMRQEMRKKRHESAKNGEGHGMGMHRGHMMKDGGKRWFEMHDANKDGSVSLAEARETALKRFDAADTNKDGTLTSDERRAAYKAMRAH